ncbi:DNA polymerase I [Candidatus Endomicrobiellum devescovinae]|jgi:DNA polymerase-1|uniref:DNA polymerase I n=1 Tax=Candidatus Endomicrobiellum devescovinae TaxID=3242322 RepID=UPI002818A421|nr:DNA polymerase I [Endomicrobium sp.]
MKKFFILDGNAYIHRAYHALPPLSTSNNQQVNAVYGFIRLLLKIKSIFTPDYIAVCFDYPSKNFRHEIFKEYKANRKPLDEALISQMPLAREAVDALNISRVEIQGYEADDLIATIVKHNKENSVQSVIVTGDKDILQLTEDENVLVWNDSKDIMYDAKKVEEKYGVKPNQLLDIFALTGDATDNVPGIKGIGEKTAVKLLKEYGTIKNILQNADSVKGKVGKLLQQGKDNVELSRKLIELNFNAPLDYKLNDFENKDLDIDEAVSFFEKYEFKSLVDKYSGKSKDSQKIEYKTNRIFENKELNFNDFSQDGLKFEIVNSTARALEVMGIIKDAGEFSLKTIGSDEDSLKAKIVGVSMCVNKKSFYFPIGHNDLTFIQISLDEFMKVFSPVFTSNTIKKVGYDLKQERNIYKMLHIVLNNIYFDTMLASYCLDPAKSHKIENLSKEYLNFELDGVNFNGKGIKKFSFADLPIDHVAKYSNSFSAAEFALCKIFETQIKEKNLANLFFNMEMPLIEILSEMEIVGIKIDASFLRTFNERIVSELKQVENNIYKISDKEFNINSPKQLAHVMFEKLNLPIIKKTKTGYSTDESVLLELSSYEFPSEVLKYRELQKLKSTYIDPINNYCAYYGDRIHTVFNQAVTATGRLSSTDPNLQNIPIKSTYGREFRKAFIPESGKVFISADYSQIDLRVLAHISRDKKLIAAFNEGADIHAATAREIFNIKNSEPLPNNLRNAAKSINFGIVYGISPFGLSKQLNIPVAKAKDYIDGYLEKYNGVKTWMKLIVEQALNDGYVTTITGRVRYIPELRSSNAQVRNAGERMTLNTPIQGSSADIIKIAMIGIYNELKIKGYKSLMILQVHDDLLLEVPLEEREAIISVVKDKMENAVKLDVPLLIDVKIGDNWGEMKNI